MVEGAMADYRHYGVHPGEWMEGRPASSIWTGKVKNEHRFEVSAMRCEKCGYLKLYAKNPATAPGSANS
jgi:hypothetical protein